MRRALVERIRYNLELEGVDSAAFAALRGELDATGAELGAALDRLAALEGLTDGIAARLELAQPGASCLAAPPTLERMLGLRRWLGEQPPSELRVSVIITTKSRPALLSEAIASVRARSHPHWELIVVDDGSEDETRATLEAIDDERVRSVRTEGVGSAAARNVGLDAAGGEAIAYLDDDNIVLPGWLVAVAWAFSHFDDVEVLYGARVVEDESPIGSQAKLPRLLFTPFDRGRLLEGNYVDASVIAHRAGPQARWDPQFTGIADWDLMIRLTTETPALGLPVAAVLYRTGTPGRQTGTPASRAAQRNLEARLAAAGGRGAPPPA